MRFQFLTALLALGAAAQLLLPSEAKTPEWGVRVVHVYPHDRTAFTQGLEYHDGYLYEGTGLADRSTLRKVQLETGKVVQESTLPSPLFGEGITVLNHRIVQITWQSNKGFVYDQPTFKLLNTFQYPGEGWGLTNDGSQIYMSDGSSDIRFWDPNILQEKRRMHVHDGSRPVPMLNELEFVRGEIFANIWQTDRIARISAFDGHVIGWINLPGLLSAQDEAEHVDVLNGIAYDAAHDRLFVTGKLWPKLFEVRLVRQ